VRVLVVSATFPPMKSGGSDFAFRLCERLAEAGANVHVVTSRIADVVKHSKITVDPIMSRWSWFELLRLMTTVRRFRPDVVNLHFNPIIYNNNPMVTFAPGVIKRVLPHTRVITHIESPGGIQIERTSQMTRFWRRLISHFVGTAGIDYSYGTILRDSDCIIVLSGDHVNSLSERSADVRNKAVLIPPPPIMRISSDENARVRGRELLGVGPDEFVIVHFGYINPEKGIETLFEALRLLSERHDKLRLVIVGGRNDVVLRVFNRPNYIEELHDLAEQLGITDKVIWTGYYPTESDQGSLYLRGSDLCVLPFNAGVYLNNSSFAAVAAHGLPIIATKGEFIESPFLNRRNLLLCAPKEPESLAAAIESLLNDPQLRRKLSDGALEMAREWFSWDKALERTLRIFNGSCAEPQQVSALQEE
jgi:glycosyltransferase involved in cell wall biosynthesis